MEPDVVSLARALSKLGYCSRTNAAALIRAGRVTVDGVVIRNPFYRLSLRKATIAVDGQRIEPRCTHLYLMLNKPRGYVVSHRDERGRQTIYDLIELASQHHLVPVGRLDKASEGLLLLTTDTAWADKLTRPDSHIPKVYHVHIRGKLRPEDRDRLLTGIADRGELLRAAEVEVLREGPRNQWLCIVLTEGKNRQIRRMLCALGYSIQQLVRVQFGMLELGSLPKGTWRLLTPEECHRAEMPYDHMAIELSHPPRA
ncbi:MAG: pseudouridine synthase [Bacteroidota bacterium]|nr:rRNA pseudouridine synthase [Chlorobiota bacterium]MDW8075389.1 pseudouridine synthase [Bacteroidota bacterium]MDW8272174.1 pseudouridine synthase [Bacteroidota bacterium]